MEIATLRQVKDIGDVEETDIDRLKPSAAELNARSMELTDAWGAMFVLSPDLVRDTAKAVGLSESVSGRLYEAIQSIADVRRRTEENRSGPRRFTYHAFPGALMVLRGYGGLARVLEAVDDDYLDAFLASNAEAFGSVVDAHPEYAANLLFSPEVAARVLHVFGSTVSPEAMLDLALSHGANCAEDAEGRVGCSSSFIRGVALVLAARY